MFLTKSETQWSVTRVLWLIKVFPWKLFLSLSLSFVLSTHISRHAERFCCHRSYSGLCIPSSANCDSMGKHHSTFNGFQSLSSHRFSFKYSHKQHIWPWEQRFVCQWKSRTACFAHKLYQTAFSDAQNAQCNIHLHILTLFVAQLD